MNRVVVDTNIIIDHLRDRTDDFENLKEKSSKGQVELIIPTLVATELFAGSETKDRNKLVRIEEITAALNLVDIDFTIAQESGFLIRDYTALKDPIDAIIAATTIHLNAQLATRNKKDFDFINGLKLYEGV